jgi:membrane carboxypeptidase/penicillin-binding protein PbpC
MILMNVPHSGMIAASIVSYRVSTQFEYRVERRPSLLYRIRRSIWRFYRDTMRTAGLMIVAGTVGIGLFQLIFWYAGVLDQGVNAVVDNEYRRMGIEPTRDRREDAEFRQRASEVRRRRDAARGGN